MELRHSWEADRSSDSQGIPRILWNVFVRYLFHNSPPPLLILIQIEPVHAPLSPQPDSGRSILIYSFYLNFK